MQIVIDNLLTNYKIYGENNSPILVILHGWRSNLNNWENVAQKLAQNFRVVALDLPGLGSTAQPKSVFSIYDYAEFVEHFLHKLNISNYHLLGHSFGGRIGLILGSRSAEIQKLILVDSAGIEKQPKLYKFFLFFAKMLKRMFPQKLVSKVKRKLGSKDYHTAGEMKEIFIKVINEDLEYLLPKITKETLIVWGSNDKTLDVKMTKTFHKLISNSKVRIIWGAGHQPHLDKEDALVEVIQEFLNA